MSLLCEVSGGQKVENFSENFNWHAVEWYFHSFRLEGEFVMRGSV